MSVSLKISMKTRLRLKGILKIPLFLFYRFAIYITLSISIPFNLIFLVLGICFDNCLLFCIGFACTGAFLFNKIINLKLNDYIQIDRLRGTLHMSSRVSRICLKKQLGKDIDDPKKVLQFLTDQFLKGVELIPQRTAHSLLLKGRTYYITKTHKSIIDELQRRGIKVQTKYLNRKPVYEKLALYKFTDMFNVLKIRFLLQQRPKYEVKIEMKELIRYIEEIEGNGGTTRLTC